MIIEKERWDTLTCRQVLDLIKEYNKTAPQELQFYFADEPWRKDRLVCAGITFTIREHEFYSDDLFIHKRGTLYHTSLMTPEEYITTVLKQDCNASSIVF